MMKQVVRKSLLFSLRTDHCVTHWLYQILKQLNFKVKFIYYHVKV